MFKVSPFYILGGSVAPPWVRWLHASFTLHLEKLSLSLRQQSSGIARDPSARLGVVGRANVPPRIRQTWQPIGIIVKTVSIQICIYVYIYIYTKKCYIYIHIHIHEYVYIYIYTPFLFLSEAAARSTYFITLGVEYFQNRSLLNQKPSA